MQPKVAKPIWKELGSKLAYSAGASVDLKEDFDEDPIEIYPYLRKNLPVPVTLINTRDCFAYDLKFSEEKLDLGEERKNVTKKQYYFDPAIENGFPENFKQVLSLPKDADMKNIENLKIGITCYENFFTPQEMEDMEKLIMQTEKRSLNDGFLPMTAQKTYTGTNLKRTKFFFGYRYMWTRT